VLPTTTVTSMWQAIRRLERAVAEQDRRTTVNPAASSARTAAIAPLTARAEPVPAAELAAPAPMAPAAPLVIRPDADEWVTVFEAPAADTARLTVYLRVRAELADANADAAGPAVRVLIGAAELFTAPVADLADELAADPDGYAVAGPLAVPASGAALVSSVRLQVRGPAGAALTVWPPWLAWRPTEG
jgi:hypothetical protein